MRVNKRKILLFVLAIAAFLIILKITFLCGSHHRLYFVSENKKSIDSFEVEDVVHPKNLERSHQNLRRIVNNKKFNDKLVDDFNLKNFENIIAVIKLKHMILSNVQKQIYVRKPYTPHH